MRLLLRLLRFLRRLQLTLRLLPRVAAATVTAATINTIVTTPVPPAAPAPAAAAGCDCYCHCSHSAADCTSVLKGSGDTKGASSYEPQTTWKRAIKLHTQAAAWGPGHSRCEERFKAIEKRRCDFLEGFEPDRPKNSRRSKYRRVALLSQFLQIRGPFCGRPSTRALPFQVYSCASDFWKLPSI